jgi:hypothetical protein
MEVASKQVQLPQMKLGMLGLLPRWGIGGYQIFQWYLSLAEVNPVKMIQWFSNLNLRQLAQLLPRVEARR